MRLYDLHIHSDHSPDGFASVEEIIERAVEIGLSGIAITDHDTLEGSLKALEISGGRIDVIPGMEISTREGHILAYGVKEPVPPGLGAAETVGLIHRLGGIAVAAHPYDWFRSGVGIFVDLGALDLDGIEAYNGRSLFAKNRALSKAKELGLPVFGGSDAHVLREMGNGYTVFDDDFHYSEGCSIQRHIVSAASGHFDPIAASIYMSKKIRMKLHRWQDRITR